VSPCLLRVPLRPGELYVRADSHLQQPGRRQQYFFFLLPREVETQVSRVSRSRKSFRQVGDVSPHGHGQVDLRTVHRAGMHGLVLGLVGCVSVAKCLQGAELSADCPHSVFARSGGMYGL